MKKQITLKRLLFIGTLALAVFLIGSCKKDLLMGETPNSFEPIPSTKLTAVKQWYSRNEGLITSEYNWLNTLSPNWDSVRTQNNGKGSIYEVVVNNPDKIFATDGTVNLTDSRKKFARKSSIRLLIFRDESGQSYKSCFMEVIATGESELPQQLSYMNYGNLNGLVSFYELDGRISNSWVYSNGKAVMSTSSPNVSFKAGRSAASKSGSNGHIMSDDGPPEGYIDCGNRLVAHTRTVCNDVGGLEGPGYDGGEGSGKICHDQMYFVSERIYCPIPSGGSGDGQYDPPNPTTPGAGGTANNITPSILVDSTARPCMGPILAKILAGANLTGTLRDMMNVGNTNATNTQNAISYLANLPNYRIPVGEAYLKLDTTVNADGSFSIAQKNGQTHPTLGYIQINTITMNEATDLAVAATMIHELMHSYLVYGAQHLTGTEKVRFEDVNRYIFNPEDSTPIPPSTLLSDLQHYQMAETYVNSMGSLLQTVANSMGITASPNSSVSLLEYCKDIFWGSLQQTSGLTPPNPTRSTNNSQREYKNKSNSTHVKGC